ncbi:MAG: ammonium transporter, partial [Candidatus Brocadiales bacterium]
MLHFEAMPDRKHILLILPLLVSVVAPLLSLGSIYAMDDATLMAMAPPPAQRGEFPMERNPDVVWLVVAACMVFFMQVGFTALESGLVQAKNAINISIKNIIVFIVASVVYFLSGFALMFGNSQAGLVGASHFFFMDVDKVPLGFAFAFFQVVFAGTAATILTGAMAERTRMFVHIWYTVMMMCIIYPIFGHWVWGHMWIQDQSGWLGRMGFVDFAGSTVVHSIGGWAALAGALVVGPRIGKYNKDGTANRIGQHNIPIATIGTFFLWFGWFGFNGGSMLKADVKIALIISNTNIAAGAAGCAAILYSWVRNKRLDGVDVLIGVLGGLVAITAGSNRLSP